MLKRTWNTYLLVWAIIWFLSAYFQLLSGLYFNFLLAFAFPHSIFALPPVVALQLGRIHAHSGLIGYLRWNLVLLARIWYILGNHDEVLCLGQAFDIWYALTNGRFYLTGRDCLSCGVQSKFVQADVRDRPWILSLVVARDIPPEADRPLGPLDQVLRGFTVAREVDWHLVLKNIYQISNSQITVFKFWV